jgi:hypothetical protein
MSASLVFRTGPLPPHRAVNPDISRGFQPKVFGSAKRKEVVWLEICRSLRRLPININRFRLFHSFLYVFQDRGRLLTCKLTKGTNNQLLIFDSLVDFFAFALAVAGFAYTVVLAGSFPIAVTGV